MAKMMSAVMKSLLFVIYSLDGGGGEKALVNLLNCIPEGRYQIFLQMFENRGINLQYVPKHVHILPALFEKGMLSGKTQILTALKRGKIHLIGKKVWYTAKALRLSDREKTYYVWKVLKSFCPVPPMRFDVAIAFMHGLITYYVVDCICADRKIGWVHTDYSKIHKVEGDLKYFQKLDTVVTVSETCKESFLRIFPTVRHVEMLSNIQSLRMIRELAAQGYPKEYQERKVKFRLASLGRLIPLKGFDMAIDAAWILKQQGISFRWFILGEGECRNELERMIQQRDLYDEVCLLGVRANPYPYIANADMIIQTSRYEGKSVVLDEAKILGRVIVATAYDSVRDQITDSKNGIIVPMEANGIADGIKRLCTDEAFRVCIIKNTVDQLQDQETLLEQYFHLFEDEPYLSKDEEKCFVH